MATKRPKVFSALTAVVLLNCVLSGAEARQAKNGTCDGTIVDKVWTGARTHFGSARTARYAFVAYYNAGRDLTVARVDLESCTVERKVLPSVFAGWDSHNLTSIVLDPAQVIHVAGNMHGSPLQYFRGKDPLDIMSLAAARMVGTNELKVTYPKFLNIDGNLHFLYRDGKAGDGEWYINRLDGGHWQRFSASPIFAAEAVDSSYGRASAYPSELYRSSDGILRVAVVWRAGTASKDRGVQNNFRLSYAQTRDLKHWTTHDGRPLATPLTTESMEIVDDVGINNGLISAKLAAGRGPHIVYSKYTQNGRNGIFVAKPSADGWITQKISESRKLQPVTGRGSLRDIPRFTVRGLDDGPVEVTVNFTGERTRKISLAGGIVSKQSHLSLKQAKKLTYPDTVTAILDRLDDGQIRTSIPEDANNAREAGLAIRFIWASEKPNNDLPRECTLDKPTACKPPPSPLVLQVRP